MTDDRATTPPQWTIQTPHSVSAALAELERYAGMLLPRQFNIRAAVAEYRASLVHGLPRGFSLDEHGRLTGPVTASRSAVCAAAVALGSTYTNLDPARILAKHRYRRRQLLTRSIGADR